MTERSGNLKTLTQRQPVDRLTGALAALNAATKEWDAAARLAHAALVDAICERSPAAGAVYEGLALSSMECDEIDMLMIAAALGQES